MTDPNTALNEALRQAASTTSWLWDHIHIKQGSQDNMFSIVGDVEVHICGGGAHEHSDAVALAANAKCAARKAMDWMVNGESGLKSALQPANIYLSDQEFTNEDIERFATGVPHSPGIAHRATAFMMTRKQLRALLAATPSLIKKATEEEEPSKRLTLFGRSVIVNDYIDWEAQDIWGLNLSPDGLHLWETEDGIRKQDDTLRVLWDLSFGYKLSTDVTVMRQA